MEAKAPDGTDRLERTGCQRGFPQNALLSAGAAPDVLGRSIA